MYYQRSLPTEANVYRTASTVSEQMQIQINSSIEREVLLITHCINQTSLGKFYKFKETRIEESTSLDMEPDITLKVTEISMDRQQRNSVKCRQNRLDI